MYYRTPRLEIYPERITANAQSVIKACHDHGGTVACVTKVTCRSCSCGSPLPAGPRTSCAAPM